MTTKRRILLAFGTRPEAIKLAPLCHALRRSGEFQVVTCVTGQHRHMLDQVLKLFELVPDVDLDLMKPNQDLYDVTAAVLLGMREVIREQRPDALVVQGDTTTALAASMAGFYSRVPVAHVEAGLRTHDVNAPFPEEFNRQVATRVARWHFAPTECSRRNLLAERVAEADVTVTGNTVIDALHWVLARVEADPKRAARLEAELTQGLGFHPSNARYVLVTGHRRENFGEGFHEICSALRDLALRYQDVQFVYPVHLNPNVQTPVRAILSDLPNVRLLDPLDYEPFVYLLKHAVLVLTDSGGIQEEAPSLGKPVLVMRETTERPEAVEAGTVRLVGADRRRIVGNVAELLENPAVYQAMARAHNPYGDGRACERIISVLREI